MGVHISKVKSVDLDSWTDEQLQSVLKWGNSRANKYWEAKLAPGHVPSEAKIENFIRTKYDSKRWVMDGPIPDPTTLDADGDDDMPLNLVKEKHNIERSNSQRTAAAPAGPSQIRRAPQPDLFADDVSPTPRANTASPSTTARPPPKAKAEAAPPKQTKPADSLLGLDFFGTASPPPNRPASTTGTPTTQSRPDLKQSILSLYASAPKPQQQPQHAQHASTGSFGGMQSPSGSAFGGMTDAFSGLSFGGSSASSPAVSQPPKQSAFAGLGNISSHRSSPSQVSSPASNFGGSFFDTKPTQKPTPPPAQSRTMSASSGFGALGSPGAAPTAAPANSSLGDLFDFSTPASQAAPKQTVASPPPQSASAFNLSQVQTPAQSKQQPPPAASMGWGNDSNAWGSDNAWADPAPSKAPLAPVQAVQPPVQSSSDSFGWGGSGSLANQSIIPGGSGGFSTTSSPAAPKVSADDDFGGWSSAAPITPAAPSTSTVKPASGFGGSDDLFSNVWG